MVRRPAGVLALARVTSFFNKGRNSLAFGSVWSLFFTHNQIERKEFKRAALCVLSRPEFSCIVVVSHIILLN